MKKGKGRKSKFTTVKAEMRLRGQLSAGRRPTGQQTTLTRELKTGLDDCLEFQKYDEELDEEQPGDVRG
ncbi:MAG: hypothetical protein LBO05_11715, partial [Deltaproteobacteria bacterium]|nr:hypothetical protein [Deltaproteobacteria bacterium]